jgi:hypothetical protein
MSDDRPTSDLPLFHPRMGRRRGAANEREPSHGSIGPEIEGHLLAADTKPVAGSRSIRRLPASRWLVWASAPEVVAVT